MLWIKSPQDLIDDFNAVAQTFPEAETKKMFGYPSLFVNGHLTAGLFQDRIMLRLSEADQAAFLKLPGTGPFAPMPGRPMKGYVAGPGSLAKDGKRFRKWVEKAVTFTSSLPRKAKKKKASAPSRAARKP